MGTVYEAEQDNPRRTVALKVIRPGLVSPELVKRFSHEAQILARLQHSGIAQVYEAGMGEDGQPFFAMEFIRGMPLDEYARSRGLDAAARLELLARVCDAVQHAHDKGVIHRDLKPGNILVDEIRPAQGARLRRCPCHRRRPSDDREPNPDRPTARHLELHEPGTDRRRPSRARRALGCVHPGRHSLRAPGAPAAVPTRAASGARGRTGDPSSRNHRGWARSTRFTAATSRSSSAKALEKDKTRRYASAGDLASDIRRYLRGEAILARPASALYQLRKFARRHRALVAGASGIFAALLVGTVVSIVFALRAAENARVADENARVANERERVATYQSYRARIAAAVAALSHHDVADAARQLDAAPEALRGWEWRHLRTRLDDSTTVFPAAAGEYPVPDP